MLKRKERSNSRFFHSQMQCRSVTVRLRENLILSPRSLYFFSTDQLYHSGYKNIFIDSTTNACLILLRDPWAIKGGLILEDSFPECSLLANCGDKRGRGEGKLIFEERCLIFTRAIHIETWFYNIIIHYYYIYIHISSVSIGAKFSRDYFTNGWKSEIDFVGFRVHWIPSSKRRREGDIPSKYILTPQRETLERNSTISKRLNCCSTGLQFLFFSSLDDYTLRK